MTKFTLHCDFGSGTTLSVGEQSAHAVVAIREPGATEASATIALTHHGLRRLAAMLNAQAAILEARSV